ncbi:MAG: Fic family protein, partial [Bacteroidetes bacterium]|nr:Fic family protein [Bacteroidota bacterium]
MGQKTPYSTLPKLPPKTSAVETLATLKVNGKAAAALAELKGIAKTIPNQEILINAIVLQESKDSSEIENIVTTNDELYKALTLKKDNSSPQTKEVVNYRKAILFGSKLLKEQGFIRVNDILQIQELLVDNSAGIRSTPGTVLKNDKTGEIVYIPPQDKEEILHLLDNFIDHFHAQNNTPGLINLAILHFQFESIHP